jgi:hypothetical protein
MTRYCRRYSAVGLCAFVLVALGAWAFGGSTAASPSRASDIVTTEEIDGSTVPNAYDLISRIRPQWLRGRGSPDIRGGSPALPVVYVAGVRYGPVSALRGLATSGILEMTYIDAPTATTRYGNGHGGGVIDVVLRRR